MEQNKSKLEHLVESINQNILLVKLMDIPLAQMLWHSTWSPWITKPEGRESQWWASDLDSHFVIFLMGGGEPSTTWFVFIVNSV